MEDCHLKQAGKFSQESERLFKDEMNDSFLESSSLIQHAFAFIADTSPCLEMPSCLVTVRLVVGTPLYLLNWS